MEQGSSRFFTMTDPKKISIQDYTYELPSHRIALHPLAERDSSKLLVYRDGGISQDVYSNIAEHLPTGSMLIFNDTKVIRARLRFQKSSGAFIEIFCLEPFEAVNEYSTVMNRKGSVKWKCMIGGLSKWKEDRLLTVFGSGDNEVELSAKLVEKISDAYVVEFSWRPAELSFAEVLETAGDIPLPPYIKRKTEIDDTERYQTIYAKDEGSVAAPTAGLHFTDRIFTSLAAKNIKTGFVTLHVGAGTFKPVKAAVMQDHEMHAEWIDVDTDTIELLISQLGDPIVATGTTSLRTLESLYWLGAKASQQPGDETLELSQWEVYEEPLSGTSLDAHAALTALHSWLRSKGRVRLFTRSQILIAPGYSFRIADAIITNFHQPQSTLLLLVAAAIGPDWKKVYEHAMQHEFRFLSYGDGSLLFIRQ
jgi:S-adenosylmethionine:tRNA ribosyltransferase-isomerase